MGVRFESAPTPRLSPSLAHVTVVCLVTSCQLVAGEEHVFTVQAIDKLGFAQLDPGDNFTVSISGPGFPALCPDLEPQTCRDANVGYDLTTCMVSAYTSIAG